MNPMEVSQPFKHLMKDEYLDGPKHKGTMGKDDFMKLLLTQLQHQDPMKPMDHHEFLAQLAQFGTLEQLTNIGTGIQTLRTGMGEGAKLQALGMIGKRIQSGASELNLVEGHPVPLPLQARSDIKPTRCTIYDGGGNVVSELDLTQAKGDAVQWDGKSQEGRQLSSGKYTYKLFGTDATGHPQEIGTELSGKVVGMEMNGQNAQLIVETAHGQTRVDMSKVTQVTAETESRPAVAPAPVVPQFPKQVISLQSDEGETQEANDESHRDLSGIDPSRFSQFFRAE